MKYTLADYTATIDNFNRSRPDMDSVRDYNHTMINIFDSLQPMEGKILLDVGASPHGYTLEKALTMKVSQYVGIGLGVPGGLEVQSGSSHGKLFNMNAEDLKLGSETFDLIISLSTFEHFINGEKVLDEMYRVLKPGGHVLINFQPIWTSPRGHHLHHIDVLSKLIPPWGHLLCTEKMMIEVLGKDYPVNMPMSLDEVIHWIYRSSEINRVDIVTLRKMLTSTKFHLEWLTPLVDDESVGLKNIAEYLSKILSYTTDDLVTKGFSVFNSKDARTSG